MNEKHTQGPWIAKAGIGRWNVTTSDKPRTFNICSINTDRVEQEANAKLIAAAPELLEALKLVLPLAKGYAAEHLIGSNSAYCQQADEVIAKATE